MANTYIYPDTHTQAAFKAASAGERNANWGNFSNLLAFATRLPIGAFFFSLFLSSFPCRHLLSFGDMAIRTTYLYIYMNEYDYSACPNDYYRTPFQRPSSFVRPRGLGQNPFCPLFSGLKICTI